MNNCFAHPERNVCRPERNDFFCHPGRSEFFVILSTPPGWPGGVLRMTKAALRMTKAAFRMTNIAEIKSPGSNKPGL